MKCFTEAVSSLLKKNIISRQQTTSRKPDKELWIISIWTRFFVQRIIIIHLFIGYQFRPFFSFLLILFRKISQDGPYRAPYVHYPTCSINLDEVNLLTGNSYYTSSIFDGETLFVPFFIKVVRCLNLPCSILSTLSRKSIYVILGRQSKRAEDIPTSLKHQNWSCKKFSIYFKTKNIQ